MDVELFLALRIEGERARLAGIAYRLLGDYDEAEDAVHEAWLRAAGAGSDDVASLSDWLTSLISQICLDRLRARGTGEAPMPAGQHGPAIEPDHAALLADSVGIDLLVALDRLAPEERVAFVLHDLFELESQQVAPAIGTTTAEADALVRQAQRRVFGETAHDPALAARRAVVEAFNAASRFGHLAGMIAVLADDVVFHADPARKRIGTCEDLRGAERVAHNFKGRAQFSRVALLDGEPGVIVAPLGRLLYLFRFAVEDGKISAIEAMADEAVLAGIEIRVLE